MPIRAIVVDDEAIWRNQMQRLCADCGVEVVASCDGIASAQLALAAATVDVLLLDVELSDGVTGFDLLHQLDIPPPVVFVTSHRDFAIEAFKANALHYLIKPVTAQQLLDALDRLQPPPPPEQRLLQLRDGCQTCIVPLADLLYLQSSGDYSEIVLRSGRRFIMNKPMRQWRDELPIGLFLALDRFLIVNRNSIASIHPLAGGRSAIAFSTGLRLPIGATATRRIKREWGQPIDMAIHFHGRVLIFEFKVVDDDAKGAPTASGNSALAAITERGYAGRWRAEGLPVDCIGVEFSRAQRRIVAWEVAAS